MKTFLRYAWPVFLVLLIQGYTLAVPVAPGVGRFGENGRLILFIGGDVLVVLGQWLKYKRMRRL